MRLCADTYISTCSKILLKADINVVAVARTETPDISALARTYPGAMVFFKVRNHVTYLLQTTSKLKW